MPRVAGIEGWRLMEGVVLSFVGRVPEAGFNQLLSVSSSIEFDAWFSFGDMTNKIKVLCASCFLG